jgi:TetR/AcrR family transcriptional regulator, transcriptional repressor for nem operon
VPDQKPTDAATMPRRQDKREQLIAGASELIYRQGIARTTLADVAQAGDMQVGNLYYYFKTKDAIVGAVVQSHADQLAQAIDTLERRHRTPRARLKALVAALAERKITIALYGCVYGTLSSELAKGTTRPDPPGAELLRIPLEWAQRQFQEMGLRDARDLAIELIAAYQGAALIANTFGNPDVVARHARRLTTWLDSLDRL